MDQQANEQDSSSTEGGQVRERKYREVTEGDIGKLIEVTDYGQQFEYRLWKVKQLAKIKKISQYPFRTTSREAFRYARIEVQGE